jgi:hypothetical protein
LGKITGDQGGVLKRDRCYFAISLEKGAAGRSWLFPIIPSVFFHRGDLPSWVELILFSEVGWR